MTAGQLVKRLLEDEDIDWAAPPPEDAPQDIHAYADSSYAVLTALKKEGFEREPEEFWYLPVELDRTPLADGRTPHLLQVMVDPRFVEKFNDLTVWFFYSYPGRDKDVRTLVTLHQRDDKTDEHFAPVIYAMAKGVREAAAAIKNSDHPTLDSYAAALVKLIVAHVPANYRDHTGGFLHYSGRVG